MFRSDQTYHSQYQSRDGQIIFRPSCPLGNHSPQFGCPGLIPGGIIVSLNLQSRKIQLPTGQPRFILWLPSSVSWLSWATGLPHFSIPVKVTVVVLDSIIVKQFYPHE